AASFSLSPSSRCKRPEDLLRLATSKPPAQRQRHTLDMHRPIGVGVERLDPSNRQLDLALVRLQRDQVLDIAHPVAHGPQLAADQIDASERGQAQALAYIKLLDS